MPHRSRLAHHPVPVAAATIERGLRRWALACLRTPDTGRGRRQRFQASLGNQLPAFGTAAIFTGRDARQGSIDPLELLPIAVIETSEQSGNVLLLSLFFHFR